MARTDEQDRQQQDVLETSQQSPESRTEAQTPQSENTPDRLSSAENRASGTRSGGQGEVRSKNDGRLQDNLTPQQRSEIGRKGGEAVSRNREHMAEIGRKGGQAVSRDREHMADIGSKGGRS
jgi:hypothetical protein